MFDPKYFASPNFGNLFVLTPFGKIVFRNHIGVARTQEQYDFLKKYKNCFEIDKERYLADETQLTNPGIFKKMIFQYRVDEDTTRPQKQVKEKVEAETEEEQPVVKKGGRKAKQ